MFKRLSQTTVVASEVLHVCISLDARIVHPLLLSTTMAPAALKLAGSAKKTLTKKKSPVKSPSIPRKSSRQQPVTAPDPEQQSEQCEPHIQPKRKNAMMTLKSLWTNGCSRDSNAASWMMIRLKALAHLQVHRWKKWSPSSRDDQFARLQIDLNKAKRSDDDTEDDDYVEIINVVSHVGFSPGPYIFPIVPTLPLSIESFQAAANTAGETDRLAKGKWEWEQIHDRKRNTLECWSVSTVANGIHVSSKTRPTIFAIGALSSGLVIFCWMVLPPKCFVTT